MSSVVILFATIFTLPVSVMKFALTTPSVLTIPVRLPLLVKAKPSLLKPETSIAPLPSVRLPASPMFMSFAEKIFPSIVVDEVSLLFFREVILL